MKAFLSKNYVQHLLFWVIYLCSWSGRDLVYYPHFLGTLSANTIILLPIIPLIYFNLKVLIPKFLLKRKYIAYSFALTGALLIFTLITRYNYSLLFSVIVDAPVQLQLFMSLQGAIIILMELILLIFITMAFYFIREWYVKERYTRELEQKNLQSELQLLKQQIQPHFLFNTLNTIYMLMEHQSAQAKETLLQFSEILSHQLYDAQKERIALQKELDYLKSYIEIEQLRHEDLLDLECRLPMDKVENLVIAPMLLLPFVENAFKHGKSASGYWVKIDVQLQGETLHFQVENSINVKPVTKRSDKGGIGLVNVQRRLALMYPNRYTLDMKNLGDRYIVQLRMELEKSPERLETAKLIDSPERMLEL